jgi:hypothetical protein
MGFYASSVALLYTTALGAAGRQSGAQHPALACMRAPVRGGHAAAFRRVTRRVRAFVSHRPPDQPRGG